MIRTAEVRPRWATGEDQAVRPAFAETDDRSLAERRLEVRVEQGPLGTVCHITGGLGALTGNSLRSHLAPLSKQRLVLDLAGVSSIDPVGLGVLMGCIRRTHEAGGAVAVACPRPNVRRVLVATGLTHLVPVLPTVSDAVAALAEPDPA